MRFPSRRLLSSIILAIALATFFYLGGDLEALFPQKSSGTRERIEGIFPILRVIDGDTIIIRYGNEDVSVRLIGIDAPERNECFGTRATEGLRAIAPEQVYIETDPTQDVYDTYNRLLAYAYLDSTDGVLLNEYLVADGFAREYTHIHPYAYQNAFRAAERAARDQKKGLWGACSAA